MTAQEALKNYFGYDSFRPGQDTVVSALLSGRDALAIMPTGAGKSLCYQIPALLLPGLTLVISPLISLMQDQVKGLSAAGIPAAYINSALTENQIAKALQLAAQGSYKIIYVAPERLESPTFQSFAASAEISMLTVDEAHCISQWGQDFRPSYLRILDFIDSLPRRPIVSAFTATATREVKDDIAQTLRLRDPKIAYFRRNSAASQISTHDIDKLDLYGCDFLHVTGIFPAVSKSALDAVKRLMSRAKALDMFISFDPNLRPQLWKDEKEMVRTLNSLAQEADLVLPGLSEGKILTKRDTPEGIAEFYHERGVDSVIVKLGDKGAYWSTGGEHGTVPAFPVKRIVDTVGAGDGFAAGVLSAVAEGMSLQEAAARGTVIGSIQITHRGDNEGLPTRAELEAITKAGIV